MCDLSCHNTHHMKHMVWHHENRRLHGRLRFGLPFSGVPGQLFVLKCLTIHRSCHPEDSPVQGSCPPMTHWAVFAAFSQEAHPSSLRAHVGLGSEEARVTVGRQDVLLLVTSPADVNPYCLWLKAGRGCEGAERALAHRSAGSWKISSTPSQGAAR